MIKVENIETWGFEHAIRGMRNPLNSWDRSDSHAGEPDVFENCGNCTLGEFFVGKNDLALMRKLYAAGHPHRKYLRQIFVAMDITAPLYWWSEFDTYKVGTTANSCSKMHKLLHKPFEMSDFSFDKLVGYKNEVTQFRPLIEEDMVANEQWIDVDEDYSVSNYGRIKHYFKNHYRLISGSIHSDGYVWVTLHGKQFAVHRLVAKAFHPETYSENLVVNHIDGNKQNNFANNLEWVTQQENIKHARVCNFQPKRVVTYRGKFTVEQREEIKSLWDNGEKSKREIAKMYGVSHTCINDIINDKYKYAEKTNIFEEIARPLIDVLNELRDSYIACESTESKKHIWYSILQLLPESYNQRRTVTMTYENVMNILDYRQGHKLSEWNEYCDILMARLPYVADLRNATQKR